VDQIAAKELGKHTQLTSLELTLESGETGEGAEGAGNDAYLNTVSWLSPDTPLPTESNPRKLFERLFGDSDSTDSEVRFQRNRQDRSILDIVTGEVARFNAALGSSDRAKLSEYLDSIRDVERRIQNAEEQTLPDLPLVQRPAGMPASYEEHAKLMFDLEVLAYQCDLTRVVTLSLAREKSERVYRELGIEEGHHALSHHNGDPGMVAKVVQINIYQSKMFAYFLEKMRSTPDGDGSLLDHTIILYAGSMGNASSHDRRNLPAVLVGGAGYFKGGRHLRYVKEPPLANLHLALLDMLGTPVAQFGDSTGKLDVLSVV
jgi:hypothetical protein